VEGKVFRSRPIDVCETKRLERGKLGGGGGCKNFSTNRKFRVKNLEQISELSALYSKRKMLQRKKKNQIFRNCREQKIVNESLTV
jgi:hypothetical protein